MNRVAGGPDPLPVDVETMQVEVLADAILSAWASGNMHDVLRDMREDPETPNWQREIVEKNQEVIWKISQSIEKVLQHSVRHEWRDEFDWTVKS